MGLSSCGRNSLDTLKDRRKKYYTSEGIYGTKKERRCGEMNGKKNFAICVSFLNIFQKPAINIFVIYNAPWNSWDPCFFQLIDYSLHALCKSEFPVLFCVFEACPYSRWGNWSTESLVEFLCHPYVFRNFCPADEILHSNCVLKILRIRNLWFYLLETVPFLCL